MLTDPSQRATLIHHNCSFNNDRDGAKSGFAMLELACDVSAMSGVGKDGLLLPLKTFAVVILEEY
ncbi:hypothetical protein B9G39_10130 [Zooshikella ganghwensis]|uniref:Uncharacterized protein n=1 Tax=Zooshikella ganghwensis TaxID=202772 RepID=A0A4V1INH7_9GAMM|nr:hypothetical protein B9G39_10130 [Zooshikella ganghwensis]